jgi:hypothetical protein
MGTQARRLLHLCRASVKAIIVIPAYNDPCHALQQALHQAGIPFMVRLGCSDQTRARGQLLTKALETGAERIVMIDADMAPKPEQIVALANDDRVTPATALTGLYPLKGRKSWAFDMATQRAGLGFCCIHRESLERLASKLPVVEGEEMRWVPFTLPMMLGDRYLGNDFAFWERLKQTGTLLLVDHELKVGHRFVDTFTEPDR